MLDWPKDDKGAITDTDNKTFFDICRSSDNPSQCSLSTDGKGDIKFIPMLEIELPGNNTNLPLTTRATISMSPTPAEGNVPAGYGSGSISFEQVGADVAVDMSQFVGDLQNVQIFEGSCDNRWATFRSNPPAVAAIPYFTDDGPAPIPNATFRDWADGNHFVFTGYAPFGESCGQIPNLPYDGDKLVDQEALTSFGITVRNVTSDGSKKVAYAPLNLITDPDTDERVAFSARMLYEPAARWDAQQVRMVWVVRVLTDGGCTAISVIGSCLEEGDNIPQLVQTYDDSFQLTGLSVREDHGTQAAIIFEDPEVDAAPNVDATLLGLANGLDNTFLRNRDCDIETDDGQCYGDGDPDITIPALVHRFNHTTNIGIPEVWRWGLPDTLHVESFAYDFREQATGIMGTQEVPRILDSYFTEQAQQDPTFNPSLLFARSESFLPSNLEEQGLASGGVNWSGSALTMNVRPSGTGIVQHTNSIHMTPFEYNSATEAWSATPMREYWNVLADRYDNSADAADQDVAAGQMLYLQLMYLSLNQGLSNLIALGDIYIDPVEQFNDSRQTNALLNSGMSALERGGDIIGAGQMIMGIGSLFDEVVDTSGKTLFAALGSVARNTTETLDQQSLGTLLQMKISAKYAQLKKALNSEALAKLVVAGVAVVAVMAIAGLVLANVLTKGKAKTIVNDVTLGLTSIAIGVIGFIGPIYQLGKTVSTLKSAASVVAGVATSTAASAKDIARALLSAGPEVVGGGLSGSVIGLLLAVGISWGMFMWQFFASGVQVGTVAFNTLIAGAVAATLVALIFFALSLTGIGTIIVAVLGLIDALITGLCKLFTAGKGNSCDFGIVSFITQQLTDFIYFGDMMIDTDREDPPLVDLTDLNIQLVRPDIGMREGNQVIVSTKVLSTAYHKTLRSNSPAMLKPSLFTPATLRQTTMRYQLGPYEQKLSVGLNQMNGSWYNVDPYIIGRYRYWALFVPIDKNITFYKGTALSDQSAPPFDLVKPGLNISPPLYLNMGLAFPMYECWVQVCKLRAPTISQQSQNIGDSVYLDVFPATLDAFYKLDWDPAFGTQIDHDGDGLVAARWGGNDPNDSPIACSGPCWDSDGDGLSDRFEMESRARGVRSGGYLLNPYGSDTDQDGLNDRDEIRVGSNPALADTDSDGLSDAEEVNGWLFTYATGEQTRITSDPRDRDKDGDGMSDLAEKSLHQNDPVLFPFHPSVWNPSPVSVYSSVDDADFVVLPDTTLVYSATVQHKDGTKVFSSGQLTSDYPDALGGGNDINSFALPEGNDTTFSHTLTSSGSSQTVGVVSTASAELSSRGVGALWSWQSTPLSSFAVNNVYFTSLQPTQASRDGVTTLEAPGNILPTFDSNQVVNSLPNASIFQRPQTTDIAPTQLYSTTAEIAAYPVAVECGYSSCLRVWSERSGPTGDYALYGQTERPRHPHPGRPDHPDHRADGGRAGAVPLDRHRWQQIPRLVVPPGRGRVGHPLPPGLFLFLHRLPLYGANPGGGHPPRRWRRGRPVPAAALGGSLLRDRLGAQPKRHRSRHLARADRPQRLPRVRLRQRADRRYGAQQPAVHRLR